jgi:hypothetical protein
VEKTLFATPNISQKKFELAFQNFISLTLDHIMGGRFKKLLAGALISSACHHRLLLKITENYTANTGVLGECER